MKKLLIYWLIPMCIAMIFVILIRWFYFFELVIIDNSMSQTFNIGEKVLCSKSKTLKRNVIVVFKNDSINSGFNLKRQIAVPGDTIKISNSLIYLNGKRIGDAPGVCYNYVSYSDSIFLACNYLNDSELLTDYRKSYLGIFTSNLTVGELENLQANPYITNIKREITIPFVTLIKKVFGNRLYWNKDNLGSVIVPQKGMTIILGRKSVLIYKDIIESESKGKINISGGKYFLGSQELKSYTFKNNYFFLLNDNRANSNDSRTIGFVPENRIVGKYFCTLPW